MLLGHTDIIRSTIVTLDRNYLWGGSDDNTLLIWSLLDQKTESILSGQKSTVNAISGSSDRKFLVSGSQDSTFKVWSIPERSEICTYTGHLGAESVAVSCDGRFVASG